MLAVVVAGSQPVATSNQAFLTAADLVVAVDGGADALARVGVRPNVLVGDFDSISPQVYSSLVSAGIEIWPLPRAKDETDTEAALQLVAARGATDIVLLGALGGPRVDHLVGNLLLLASPWLEGRRVRLLDDLHEIFLAQSDAHIEGCAEDTVSLLPLSPIVHDVCTKGLLYPLSHEKLPQGSTRGVSNAMTGAVARVTHGEGALLVVHYRGR